ncbi:MAG TPA: ABC transporter ATP-binding protein, partial [Geminicoccaceae bacterium]|nr:ABC transporter ATP-binding protein [Geminicoccaceae bacterium]
MAGVTLEDVSKSFDGTRAVRRVRMEVAPGEFVALLGPSGCGKTTLLRLLAGFERPDAGRIAIGNETVAGGGVHVAPERRGIGMVFQSYALWPHMTVADNVGYALKVRRLPRAEREAKVREALHTVGLAELAGRRPAQLSGGQRQRVALARAIVVKPSVLLLDEPLSNLDAKMREEMQIELRRIQRTVGTTMIL